MLQLPVAVDDGEEILDFLAVRQAQQLRKPLPGRGAAEIDFSELVPSTEFLERADIIKRQWGLGVPNERPFTLRTFQHLQFGARVAH